jgi:N-acetylneuraminate synthase
MSADSKDEFQIAGLKIGFGSPSFVIAEIAQAHDGSLGTAHAYIDSVAKVGASAIKFQTHIAQAESTRHERFRVAGFPQDQSRYDYWKRMEFTEEQWIGLARHAREAGLVFLSTPFSVAAIELLERLAVPAWKVGSGEISNLQFIGRVARTGLPVILSSGMATWLELDVAVAAVRVGGSPLAVLQCTTSYPCPPEVIGLNVIGELRARYGCPVGLSDHSGTIYASYAAATLGANIIEVHTTFSRECFGPDVPSSVTTTELGQLVAGVRFIEKALASPVEKDREADARSELRQLFGRSLVAARDLPAGHVLAAHDVTAKKPGTGLPPSRLTSLLGRRLARAYRFDDLIEERDLE